MKKRYCIVRVCGNNQDLSIDEQQPLGQNQPQSRRPAHDRGVTIQGLFHTKTLRALLGNHVLVAASRASALSLLMNWISSACGRRFYIRLIIHKMFDRMVNCNELPAFVRRLPVPQGLPPVDVVARQAGTRVDQFQNTRSYLTAAKL